MVGNGYVSSIVLQCRCIESAKEIIRSSCTIKGEMVIDTGRRRPFVTERIGVRKLCFTSTNGILVRMRRIQIGWMCVGIFLGLT
jgi:hypothetical protein